MLAQRRAREHYDGSEKDLQGCCVCSKRAWAVGIGLLELAVSTASIVYTMLEIYYYPRLLPEIIIHDNIFSEARKHSVPPSELIPKGLLYWDLFLFSIEFVLAVTLLYGIAESKLSRIRCWMTFMITYNVILTGVFFGFIIGGISSSRLNFVGFLHSFFRFLEIAIVFGYYEELNNIRKEQRLLLDNNNTVAIHQHDYGAQEDRQLYEPQIMIPIPV
jgi:hypothetical protein